MPKDYSVMFRLPVSDPMEEVLWEQRFKCIEEALYKTSLRTVQDIRHSRVLSNILEFFDHSFHERGPSLIMRIGDDYLIEYNYPMSLTHKMLFRLDGTILRQLFVGGSAIFESVVEFAGLMKEIKPFNCTLVEMGK